MRVRKITKTWMLLVGTVVLCLTGCGKETQTADFSGVTSVCELATLKCYYHNVAKAETEASGIFAKWLKTGYKKIWTEYSGIIEYGIDISQVTVSEPDKNGVVTVTMPDAQVLNVDVDEDSLGTPLTDTGFLTSVTTEEKTTTLAGAQEAMEQQAKENTEMLSQAKARAKTLIEEYIKNVGESIGEEYTVQMYLQDSGTPGTYDLVVSDVCNSEGDSIFVKKTTTTTNGVETTTYSATGVVVQLGGATYTVNDNDIDKVTGKYTLSGTGTASQVLFDSTSGEFAGTKEAGLTRPATSVYANKSILFNVVTVPANSGIDDTFTHYNSQNDLGGVEVDVSYLTQYSKGGVGNTSYTRGDANGKGAGNIAGEMRGLSIDQFGKIIGTYTNGEKRVLGQIAVTTFSNPSGLEAVGDSLFAASMNSGLFDGVGMDITSDGGKFTVGALEMSNVDLSTEFTQMITTQRGFQANSRIITTSDTMLEELVNLKR